jgi:hypothetical protein
MHCASGAVVGLWELDAVMFEAFAIETFAVCLGDAGYEASTITLAHVGFEFEEVF